MARAIAWIRERDDESATLIVTDRETATPVGLMILFEIPCEDSSGRIDVRLGYLLAESAWSQGLGTELVAGFVEWCLSKTRVRSISGGVGLDNPASAQVLIKNGFVAARPAIEGEQVYELVLTARNG
jgi:RimJ/RimL family protein N-acetyltransferase